MAYQRPMPQVSPWLAASEAVRSLFEQRRQEAIAQRQQDIENELNSRRVGVAEGGLGLGRDEFGLRGRIYDEGAGQRAADFAQTGAATDATIANTARTKQTTGFEADDRSRLLTALSMLPEEQTAAAPSPRLLGTLKTLGGPDFTTASGRATMMTPGALGAQEGQATGAAWDAGERRVAADEARLQGDQQVRAINARAAAEADAVPIGTEQSDQINEALATVQRIRQTPGQSGAVGLSLNPIQMTSRIITGKPVPGTQAANYNRQIDVLKARLTLPRLKMMKGFGALSDAEGRRIQDAATALSPDMTPDEFDRELGVIEDGLNLMIQRSSGVSPGAPTRRRLVRGPNGQLQFAR